MPLEIVYLDDEIGLCETFTDNLSSKEVAIKTFVSPDEAVKYIAANPPDLIFLDYRLPNTSGFEVALRIKGQMPMALISGHLSLKLQPPFVKIFPKPFDFAEMEAFIQSYVDLKKVV